MNSNTLSQEQITAFLIEHYPANGVPYCMEHLGLSRSQIYRHTRKHGLRVNPGVSGRNLSQTIRKRETQRPAADYNVHMGQFTSVDTPEAAYILGLLWADGYVIEDDERCDIRLSLVEPDCKWVVPTFLKTGKWRITHRETEWQPVILIQTSHRPLCRYLKAHDYTAKSWASANKILATIPAHLKHYWFRGLFDGDGCLYLNPDQKHAKFNIASSYEQDWSYMEEVFKELKDSHFLVKRTINKKGHKSSVFQVVKRSSIMMFMSYIYQGWEQDQIGLPRKHDKYLQLIERDKRLNSYFRRGSGARS